jgi:hypothetical protein
VVGLLEEQEEQFPLLKPLKELPPPLPPNLLTLWQAEFQQCLDERKTETSATINFPVDHTTEAIIFGEQSEPAIGSKWTKKFWVF